MNMPKIDFGQVDDVQDFSPLPAGKYLCRLIGLEEASTQHGDEMWKLRFEVIKGPYAGRLIFDNLVFSDAALKRAKLICSRLGLDVSKELDLTPELIKGRVATLTVEIEPYEDAEGRTKQRNVVPFAGYERASESDATTTAAASEDDSEEDLPF
jgi:hypothetical protein